MKTAIMIDGAFFRKKYHAAFKKNLTANVLKGFVDKIKSELAISKTDSYRVYFYDCKPCNTKTSYPISHKACNFEKTEQYKDGIKLLEDIKLLDFFAVREGLLSFTGWKLKKTCYAVSPQTDDCFVPDLQQKGVDIKIGLDMAWVSYNNITEKVVLITGDSDFIPAIKTARRSGVFVYLFTFGHNVKPELPKNADVCRIESLKSFI